MTLQIDIPENFLEDEVRSDYLVTSKMKQVWAIELDLLVKLDEVCKKHGLSYCVGAGTMLGAVRHKGFIPWDDDIDVYMLRDDYNRLMSLASEFQSPYFLQNSHTEKNLLQSYTRLRNSNTIGTTQKDKYREINRGIFIDISPLDGVSENKWQNKKQFIRHKYFRKLFEAYNNAKTPRAPEGILRRVKRPFKMMAANLLVRDKEKIIRKFDDNISKYSAADTKIWGNRTLTFNCPRSRRPLSDWQDLIYMPFEFIQVPVPRNYDSMLRQQYGDYMQIPENKGESMHGELFIDTEHSYKDI